MVLRMIEEPSNFILNSINFVDTDQKKKNYKESIALANKAVSLDLGDS